MTLRPATLWDHVAINALHRSVGWGERSASAWRWLASNPAAQDLGAPLGWIVEDETGRPAAFLGNFVQRFWHGDAVHHAATGFSIIVPPSVKGQSRALIKAFLAQPGMFAHYTFNANAKSSGLYARHGLQAWPPNTHDLKLAWVVDFGACLKGRVLRRLADMFPSRIGVSREWMTRRRHHQSIRWALPEGVEPLSDFADQSPYADFWARLKAEGGLIADRGPAIQRWRRADPDLTTPPLSLAVWRDGRIVAHATAMLGKGHRIEPAHLDIIDLVALDDATDAIPILMQALMIEARAVGAAKLRLQTVTPALLQNLGTFAASARREGGWGHCHVRFADAGPLADLWSPTPFDGDYGISLRPVPHPGRAAARASSDVATAVDLPADVRRLRQA